LAGGPSYETAEAIGREWQRIPVERICLPPCQTGGTPAAIGLASNSVSLWRWAIHTHTTYMGRTFIEPTEQIRNMACAEANCETGAFDQGQKRGHSG